MLDLAARSAIPEACLDLDGVHRFADAEYAELSLLMRAGERSGEVLDALMNRGQVVVHGSEVARTAALAQADDALVIADTREQVSTLNAAIRDRRNGTVEPTGERSGERSLATPRGEQLGAGDRIATRRNDRDLAVANRNTWTVTRVEADGGITVHGTNGVRYLPAAYVQQHVELAYATTVHGAQGETVDAAHFSVGEGTTAAAAYVAMTRGRTRNVAHLVADSEDDARRRWMDVFSRDRADLGPTHGAERAEDDIERYGPNAPAPAALQAAMLRTKQRREPSPMPLRAPRLTWSHPDLAVMGAVRFRRQWPAGVRNAQRAVASAR